MTLRVSDLYPEPYRGALVAASLLPDQKSRCAAINAATDQLVAAGLCRPRSDLSRADEWQDQRDLAAAARALRQRG